MTFKMKFDADDLKGPEPVPPGLYDLRFEGFKPKPSKNTESPSVNLNAQFSIVNNAEFENRKVFMGLNSKIPNWIQDFVHALGLEMEDQLSDEPSIPGVWDSDPATFNPKDYSTYKYAGPLTGQVGKFELGVREYQGKLSNEIRQCICAVPDCATRFPLVKHAKDMSSK